MIYAIDLKGAEQLFESANFFKLKSSLLSSVVLTIRWKISFLIIKANFFSLITKRNV